MRYARGGRRADLDNRYFRSRMEANVARWLNHLIGGEIVGWEYEPKTFVFTGITNGAVCYKPDFKVYRQDGTHFWYEVKGRETSRDRTKWKRMAKQYPEERIIVLGPTEYEDLKAIAHLIEGWE